MTLGKSWGFFRRRKERVRKSLKEGVGVVPSPPVPSVPRTQLWEPHGTVKRAAPRPASYSSPQGQGYTQDDGFPSEHIKLETRVCVFRSISFLLTPMEFIT